MLLTQASSLPSSTVTELQRLKPAKIIVLGGTSSVSASVQASLQQYTASNTQAAVTRIAGADRYATAAALSLATFTAPPVNTVYVASGQGFADALAGGPAAANAPSGGAPLLLVQAGSIPDVTKTELQRLGAQTVVVLGGASTVNESVITALDPYSVNPVVRRAGADRYLTSVAISSAAFPTSAPKVYLATGASFSDALAGGPAAGFVHGPVLLTQANCIPPAVNDEITRLNPTNLIILGGTSSVSDAVLARTVCQPPASTTSAPTPTFPGAADHPGRRELVLPARWRPEQPPAGRPEPLPLIAQGARSRTGGWPARPPSGRV